MLLRVFVCQNCSLDYVFVSLSSSLTFQNQYANETQIFTFYSYCNAKKSRACARLLFCLFCLFYQWYFSPLLILKAR